MRVPGALLLFATLTAGAFGQTSRPISDLSKRPKVDLRLIASKTAVRIGASPVILRVELWNEGTRDFWTSRALVPDTSGPAYLNDLCREREARDCSPRSNGRNLIESRII